MTTGTYLNQLNEYDQLDYKEELQPLHARLQAMTAKFAALKETVTATKDSEYIDFHARRLVEAAGHCVFGYLLLQDAQRDDSFKRSAEVYVRYGEAEVDKISTFINHFKAEDLALYRH